MAYPSLRRMLDDVLFYLVSLISHLLTEFVNE